ncbi:MAG: hypothetical protein ACREHD_25460, partial [Pirellulales bacterium]
AKPDGVTPKPGPAVTPEEIMESAYNERIDQVASDLLERLQTCNPFFFERVVVQLLRAMGNPVLLRD